MRTDCVGGVPISQWASRAPLAEISLHGWGIHSLDSTKYDKNTQLRAAYKYVILIHPDTRRTKKLHTTGVYCVVLPLR
jgi:hypothetical protein